MDGDNGDESGNRKSGCSEQQPKGTQAEVIDSQYAVSHQVAEWNSVESGYPSSFSFEGAASTPQHAPDIYHREDGMMFDEEVSDHAKFSIQVYHPPFASKHVPREGQINGEVVDSECKMFSHGTDSESAGASEDEDRKPPARPIEVRELGQMDPFPGHAEHLEDVYYHDTGGGPSLQPPFSLYSAYVPPSMHPYPPPYRSHHDYSSHSAHHLPPAHNVSVADAHRFPQGSPMAAATSHVMHSFERGLSSGTTSHVAAPSSAVSDPGQRSSQELTSDRMYPSDEELSNAKHDRDRKAIIKWYERFRQLIAFKKLTGHTCVPQKYNKNRQLGSWVNKMRDLERQRKQGKQNFLNDRMLDNLHLVGFVSAKPKGDPLWMLRYNQLNDYHAQHGNSNVPTKYHLNRALGRWVSTQRLQYRLYIQGQQSSMTRERIRLLEGLGFVWDAAPDRDGSNEDDGDFDDYTSE